MPEATLSLSPPIANGKGRVLFASLIGTTIEFFDFYIYGTAAVLVFPKLFFPAGDPATATLQSLATFALAFFSRPLGSAVFGHFGDRIGRKATLVAALLTMGISTVVIGLLPSYAQIGVAAPLLLSLCRFGQGLGLGGEWGGAVLLATENAPPGQRAWYGMFPQLGAPIGFVLCGGGFLLLTHFLDDAEFFRWGWRVPFLASSVLVLVGLWVRLNLQETPAFLRALDAEERQRLPFVTLVRDYPGRLVRGMLMGLCTFVLFYVMTVFTLTWGTTALHFSREHFLLIQLFGVLFFALGIPISAQLADRHGRRPVLMAASGAIALFGLFFAPLFGTSDTAPVILFMALGLGLMGLTYGPIGTMMSDQFPTLVRYTGASFAFNLAGIFGGSVTPYVATWLGTHQGIQAVGWYLSVAALITLFAVWGAPHAPDDT